MTQKEIKIIKAINYAGIDNVMWGISHLFGDMDTRTLYGTEHHKMVPPHIYIWRDNDGEQIKQLHDITPDCTVVDDCGSEIDLYFLTTEGGEK